MKMLLLSLAAAVVELAVQVLARRQLQHILQTLQPSAQMELTVVPVAAQMVVEQVVAVAVGSGEQRAFWIALAAPVNVAHLAVPAVQTM
jgi:hypothetical protein